jgi:hypothetical protein
MATKTIKALVLLDEPAHGLKCGQVAELDAELAEQLKKVGRIDTNPKAIAAATPKPEAPAADVIED